ncbi:MAG: amidase family protein, partial [Acidimicrobiales bacterium]
AELQAAGAVAARWCAELDRVWAGVHALALPTLLDLPPVLAGAEAMMSLRATLPVNLAGVPALSMPVPTGGFPASLQLVGPAGSEGRLLALGRLVEVANGS